MASIKFLLQSKATPANIYLQLSLGRGKVFKRKTGYSINPADWSKKGYPKDRDANLKNLKSNLDHLNTDLFDLLNQAVKNQARIDGQWLQEQIDFLNGTTPIKDKDNLTAHIQYIINIAPRIKKANNQIGLSKSRVKSYEVFINTILRYQKEELNNRSIVIKEIDFDFGEAFADWLFGKGYSLNYVGKNIDNLKAVCRDAEKRGIQVSKQLGRITSFSKQTDSEEVIILSEEEQLKISEIEGLTKSLENARSWLLLGCLVGQRFGDLIRITPDHIKAVNHIKIVELKQQKTGKLVAIPLMPKAIDILENNTPYPISLQKFNNYIKEVCKRAGLDTPTKGAKYLDSQIKSRNKPKIEGIYPKWELIGSHVCRRSFASNFYGKIPTAILKNVTLHKTESMFLRYIGRTTYDNAQQMMDYFGKLQAKENGIPKLQVLKNAN